MDISYLGQSSFRLRGKNAALVTDPYDPKMLGLKFSGVSADIVTVSHQHPDHNQSQLVKDTEKVIEGPGEYEVKGVSITGYSTFHDDKKGELRGKNTIYLIEMDDIRILHLGDLGHKLSDELIEEIGDVDILIVPVGGFYTIDSSVASEVVREVEPKIVIPMHYSVTGMSSEISSKLANVDKFLSEVGLPVEKTTKLSVRKEEIGEEQKVVVLENKE